MYTISDIPSLIGKQFTVSDDSFKTEEDEYFKGTIYTIAEELNFNIKLSWKEDNNKEEFDMYTKEDLIKHLNNKIWVLKQ